VLVGAEGSLVLTLRLDPNAPVPLHHQLQEQLRAAIDAGDIPPGGRLPSELDIAAQTGVSRTTVRRAMDELVHAGLIHRQRGRGSYVVRPPEDTADAVLFRVTSPLLYPRSPAARWERRTLTMRSPVTAPRLAGQFALPPQAPLLRLTRLCLLDGRPVALETSVLPQLPLGVAEHALTDAALYGALERELRVHISHAHDVVMPIVLSHRHAQWLRVPPRTAGLHLRRHTYAGQRLVEIRCTITASRASRLRAVVPRRYLLVV
jgi:GntR family transcriptional regulator